MSGAPPEIQALREASTFRVEVSQSGDAEDADLPFADVVRALLTAGGLQEGKSGKADLVVRISAQGKALARDYDDLSSLGQKVREYSGAELEGRCELESKGIAVSAFEFSGEWDPPDVIKTPRENPGDAPFIEPFGDFVERFVKLVSRALGPKPALAVLGWDARADDLVGAVPQLQVSAAEAAAVYARAEAAPVLRAMFRDGDPLQRAAAARGLGLIHDHDFLPELVGSLDQDDPLLKESNPTGRWAKFIDLDAAVQPVENERGELDAGPEILAAVSALYRPGDRKLLAAALRDRKSTMRRIDAAVVFGRARDRGAVDALIAATKDDEALVRATVAAALGAIGDARAIPALKSMAAHNDPDNPDGGPDATAAENALEELLPGQAQGRTPP